MQRARTLEAKDLRRQGLVTAALDEFFERGFSAARMDDIAARAGFSKGTLYLYFDSKEALFAAVVQTIAVPNLERLETAAATAGGGLEAISAIMRLAPAMLRTSPVPKIAKVIISDAKVFPAIVTAYRKTVIERFLAVIAGVLKKAQTDGEIDIGDPYLTARLVVAPIIFSAIWFVTFEHDEEAVVDLDALFSLHEKMLIRALTAQRESLS